MCASLFRRELVCKVLNIPHKWTVFYYNGGDRLISRHLIARENAVIQELARTEMIENVRRFL